VGLVLVAVVRVVRRGVGVARVRRVLVLVVRSTVPS